MTDETRKIKIPEEKLTKLIALRTQLDTEIKRLEAKPAPLKKRRTQCEEIIARYVNKTEGVQSFSTDDMQCYATSTDQYALIAPAKESRVELNHWILEPLDLAVESDAIEFNDGYIAAYQEVLKRLDVFKNEIDRKFIDQYRLDNGAEKVVTGKNQHRLDGGDLPDGVNMHRDDKPNFRVVKK